MIAESAAPSRSVPDAALAVSTSLDRVRMNQRGYARVRGRSGAAAVARARTDWGLAVLEAMSAGLPVVASDLPVFGEYLTSGRDALLVPVDDASALAAALAAVLDDPDLAASLRAKALATARRFTWARSAAEHQAIYASLARR